jgi:hypothetical protein
MLSCKFKKRKQKINLCEGGIDLEKKKRKGSEVLLAHIFSMMNEECQFLV